MKYLDVKSDLFGYFLGLVLWTSSLFPYTILDFDRNMTWMVPNETNDRKRTAKTHELIFLKFSEHELRQNLNLRHA